MAPRRALHAATGPRALLRAARGVAGSPRAPPPALEPRPLRARPLRGPRVRGRLLARHAPPDARSDPVLAGAPRADGPGSLVPPARDRVPLPPPHPRPRRAGPASRDPAARVRRAALSLALSASARWLDSFAALSLLVVGGGVAWVLATQGEPPPRHAARVRRDGDPSRGGVAEIASRRLPEASPASGVLLGTAFLAFTALLLPTAADEERRLFTRATTDALTNLPNRGTFLARSRDEIFRAERTRRTLALVLFELDGFDAVRKKMDAPAADEIVATFGQGVARAIRGIDVPARWAATRSSPSSSRPTRRARAWPSTASGRPPRRRRA